MIEPEEKNRKRLIVRGIYVYWPDKHTKHQIATDLGWEFARAALRGEPVHLLDGFVFHDSWRQKSQEKPYLDLFRTNKWKAEEKFKSLGIKGASIDRRDKTDLYTFQFCPPADGLACNITDAVRLSRHAREEFRKGDPDGWDLIRVAYEERPDARSICQALVFVDSLPKDPKPYEECLAGIKELFEKHTDILLHALFKVLCLASEERQCITKDIGNLAIDLWVNEFFQVKHVLSLLSGYKLHKPKALTPTIEEFASLAKQYCDNSEYVEKLKRNAQRGITVNEGELRLTEDSVSNSLNELVACGAVIDAAEKTVEHYGELPHLCIGAKDVYNLRQAAIEAFLERGGDFPGDPNTLYYQFLVHLRLFVGKFNKGQGIKEILESDQDKEEKWRQFQYILENMVDDKEVRSRLSRLFGLARDVVLSEPQPDLLLEVWDVLDIGREPDPQWFRPCGLLFCDFEHAKFCRRAEVDALKREVLDSSGKFVLLYGATATAKTSIVRTLMYELYREGNSQVYYFDIAPQRHFNETQLARDIRSVNGVIIIENIHLEFQKVQGIYQRFRNDSDKHFLLTSRLPPNELPDSASMDFERNCLMQPCSLEDTRRLLDKYCSDPDTPPIVSEKSEEILKVSRENFWLLALAARGCADAEGQGQPSSWIASTVKKKLGDWGFCRDKCEDQYAGILAALSPLYKNEIMTAETYLRKLGFTKAGLNGLVERGEITTDVGPSDEFHYGLHHSSLADAYWEYGRAHVGHTEILEYEEFLYNYAVSKVPNGLEAVVSAENETSGRVLARLYDKGEIIGVVEREQSLCVIVSWIQHTLMTFSGSECEELLKIVAQKINTDDDFIAICRCFTGLDRLGDNAGQKLWELLDRQKLADKLSETTDFWKAATCIHHIEATHDNIAIELCKLLNLKELACAMGQVGDVKQAGYYLSVILKANNESGRGLWMHLDQNRLAAKVILTKYTKDVFVTIYDIFNADSDTGCEFWGLIDHQELANRLVKETWMAEVIICIHCMEQIRRINPNVAGEFWDAVNPQKFADILRMVSTVWVDNCVSIIRKANPSVAEAIVRLMQDNQSQDL